MKPHVVGVPGSLADESATRTAVNRALRSARSTGASTEHLDPREHRLPAFDSDRPEAGDANHVKKKLRGADAIVLGTPMYHGSYSSPLKTVLDYSGFDEFEGKTVGLVAVSGGSYPTPALEHLRAVCRALNAWTLPLEVGVSDTHEAFKDGKLTDDAIRDRLDRLGRELVRYAEISEYSHPAVTTLETGGNAESTS